MMSVFGLQNALRLTRPLFVERFHRVGEHAPERVKAQTAG